MEGLPVGGGMENGKRWEVEDLFWRRSDKLAGGLVVAGGGRHFSRGALWAEGSRRSSGSLPLCSGCCLPFGISISRFDSH
jgi:hypothetical protein